MEPKPLMARLSRVSSSSSGMSLIEVLLALAVMSVVSLGVLNFVAVVRTENLNTEQKQNAIQLGSELYQFLSNSDICTYNFGRTNPSGNPITFTITPSNLPQTINTLYTQTVTGAVATYKVYDGTMATTYGTQQIKITSMKLDNFVPTLDTLGNYTKNGTLNFKLNMDKVNSSTGSDSFKEKKFTLSVILQNIYNAEGNNKIDTCSMIYGSGSGSSNLTGVTEGATSYKTLLGVGAGNSITTGINATYIGYNAGNSSTTANFNTAVGQGALQSATTGSVNTAIGDASLTSVTTGSYNTSIGAGAMKLRSAGSYNVAVGSNAMGDNGTADNNTAIGDVALRRLTSGTGNTALGHAAGNTLTTGSGNTFLGDGSGYLTTGSNNVHIGNNSGYNATGSGNVFLGSGSGYSETGSNKLIIGNAYTSNLIYGDFSTNKISIGSNATQEFTLNLPIDGGIMASGSFGSGNSLTTSGAGTRMFWYPKKAAFRAGAALSNEWDDANIGNYSIAMGYITSATGASSVALGRNTTASGTYSTAIGYMVSATGTQSSAFGVGGVASGVQSISLGSSCQAIGNNSLAMGLATRASGTTSTAMGDSTIASGAKSLAFGTSTTASGDNSVAGGNLSRSSGVGSTAFGLSNVASGYYSTALGSTNTANSYAETVIGIYSDSSLGTSVSAWVSTDPLFIIGNGTGSASTSNALVVLKNAKTGIGVSGAPAYQLDVGGDINSSTGLRVAGTQVCTSAGCTSSSDEKLKENIEPLENALDKILQIKGVSYNYKDKKKFTDKDQIGVIAQNVEKVFPEVVVEDPLTKIKSVAYDHLVAPIIEAIRELNQKITKLFDRSTQQEREIASLKKENQILTLESEKIKLQSQAIQAYICKQDPQAALCSSGL